MCVFLFILQKKKFSLFLPPQTTQATKVKALNNSTHVFIYRNLVKALPWYTGVREKLTDPAYQGWFIPFRSSGSTVVPKCTLDKCSDRYHDQEQTPEYPSVCKEPCDCGSVPCGEYLWDHRNQSLRTWLIQEHVLGPTGAGNPLVDGFYFDDDWTNKEAEHLPWMPKQGFCDTNSTYGGPSEVEVHCINDTGLAAADGESIYTNWQATMQQIESILVSKGKFAWQYFYETTRPTTTDECISYFKTACAPNSDIQTNAVLFQFTKQPNGKQFPLITPTQDLASFLLVRGPYAWLGYSWLGCSSGAEPPGAGGQAYELPDALNVDYGEPVGLCQSQGQGSSVFTRTWTKATVSFDCNTLRGDIVMREPL